MSIADELEEGPGMHGCRLTNKRPRAWWFTMLAMLAGVLLVACGCCNLEYVPDHDIVVLKLAPDGALEWTRVIDRGSGDAGKDLVALPDGGYAVAGQTSERRFGQPHAVLSPPQPLLVRLSPEGTVVWDRPVTDGFDVANAVVPADDGGTAVLTGTGTVVRFDQDGSMIWARSTGIPEAHALAATEDGGFLAGGRITYEVPVSYSDGPGTVAPLPVRTTATGSGDGPVLAQGAGKVTTARTAPTTPQLAQVPRRYDLVRQAVVVRLGADGAVGWERRYDDGGLTNVLALAEGDGGAGVLLVGEGPSSPNHSYSGPLLALSLAPDGTPGEVTELCGPPDWPWSVRAVPDPRGYRVLFAPVRISQENYFRGAVDAVLERDGRVLARVPLDASLAVAWTTGGGYVSVGIPPDGGSAPVCGSPGACSYLLRTFDAGGAVVGDSPFLDAAGVPFDRVEAIVPAADGGYVVLASGQNQ